MSGFAFYALGRPAPQGSKRHVGKGVMIESSRAVKPWREAVKEAAPAVERPLDGGIAVRMVFTLPRPAGRKRTDVYPYRMPDLSKLVRSTEDAITDSGLWADDARVVEYVRLAKVWWLFDMDAIPVPGVVVAAVELSERCAHQDLGPMFLKARAAAVTRTRGLEAAQ